MAAKLIECLWVSQFGSAASSGTVQFFQPGTLTPVNVYKNDAATQIATQPVALDANGRTVFPIYTTVPARAVVSDSSGATLEDVERINGDRAALVALANTTWPNETSVDAALSALSASLGGNDANFRSILTGAVDRPLRNKLADVTSVKDYGAKGDGITDDTAAFNAGLAAIQASGKPGSLLIPSGTYIVSSPISITGAGTTLRGEGVGVSIITNTSGTGNCITISNVANVNLMHFSITNQGTSTGASIAQTGTLHYYQNLNLAGHRTGISGMGGTAIAVDVATDNNAAGAAFASSTNECVLLGCTCNANSATSKGVDFRTIAPLHAKILGCTFPNNGLAVQLSNTNGTNSVVIAGCRFASSTPIAQGGTPTFSAANISPGAGMADDGSGVNVQQTAVNATLTIDISKFQAFKLKGTGGGITVTVTFTGTADCRVPIVIMFQNTSGGAVTWAAGTNVVVAAMPAPGAGQQSTCVFMFDTHSGTKLVQVGAFSPNMANT